MQHTQARPLRCTRPPRAIQQEGGPASWSQLCCTRRAGPSPPPAAVAWMCFCLRLLLLRFPSGDASSPPRPARPQHSSPKRWAIGWWALAADSTRRKSAPRRRPRGPWPGSGALGAGSLAMALADWADSSTCREVLNRDVTIQRLGNEALGGRALPGDSSWAKRPGKRLVGLVAASTFLVVIAALEIGLLARRAEDTKESKPNMRHWQWPLTTRRDLEEMSESRKDGISLELERAIKWSAIKVIIHAGEKLQM